MKSRPPESPSVPEPAIRVGRIAPTPVTSGEIRRDQTFQGRRPRRRPAHRGIVRLGRVRIQPPRGAADQQGSRRRQHRPVRVRQPRQAGYGHDHRQLHPAGRAGRRPELQRLRRRALATRSISTTTATRRTISPTQFDFKTKIRNPNTFLYNTGPINIAERHRTGTCRRPTVSRASRTAHPDGSATTSRPRR